jgi:Eukaryotic aspartyl protease
MRSSTFLPALSFLTLLTAVPAVAATEPYTLALEGGLFHSSGFFTRASLGGQPLRLQVDISQGALSVPGANCINCRVGDQRYDPLASSTGGSLSCTDPKCGVGTCKGLHGYTCGSCSAAGACCAADVSKHGPDEGRARATGPPSCAFHLSFGKGNTGNGTLSSDVLELSLKGSGTLRVPNVLFGAIVEETRAFEMPYVDGVLGMGFAGDTCYPTCTPAVMDLLSGATSLPSVMTMCVNAFGGTLAIGSADTSLAADPTAGYQFVDMINMTRSPHILSHVLGHGMVGEERVDMPELATAVWSSVTTSIVVGKVTFMAILETLMMHYCHIPGLCSTKSWFRPHTCTTISDSDLKKMPTITFFLTSDVPIALEPDDYMLAYEVVKGKQIRCVAFMIADLLSTRGIGIMLGSVVMRRHAVVFDLSKRRIGLAEANMAKCGPSSGTSAGLTASSLPASGVDPSTLLTADTPTANNATGNITPSSIFHAEVCRAQSTCSSCSSTNNCAFRYTDSQCVPSTSATSSYPYCQGGSCVCWAGWHFGVFLGAALAISISSCCLCAYTRHKRRVRYQSMVPYGEHEVETF